MKNRPIRVIIADDHIMVRSGLRFFLLAFEDLELVGEAPNGEEAIRLCGQENPDVVLMDMVMPIMDGVCATTILHARFPDIKVIGLTTFNKPEMIQKMVEAGAKSFLIKSVSATELAQAIRDVNNNKSVISPEIQELLKGRQSPTTPISKYSLSRREREVLSGIMSGLSNAEIANELVISLSTTKFHVSSILSRLNVSNRAEAVSLALREGLEVPLRANKDNH